MKTLEFEIPLYNVKVTLVQIESSKDWVDIEDLCRLNDIEPTEEFKDNVLHELTDGGDTYRNLTKRRIVVFFYPFSTPRDAENVYSHEKRHIEDRILNYYGVDDIESAGMLAGYLGEKFHEFKLVDNKEEGL